MNNLLQTTAIVLTIIISVAGGTWTVSEKMNSLQTQIATNSENIAIAGIRLDNTATKLDIVESELRILSALNELTKE